MSSPSRSRARARAREAIHLTLACRKPQGDMMMSVGEHAFEVPPGGEVGSDGEKMNAALSIARTVAENLRDNH